MPAAVEPIVLSTRRSSSSRLSQPVQAEQAPTAASPGPGEGPWVSLVPRARRGASPACPRLTQPGTAHGAHPNMESAPARATPNLRSAYLIKPHFFIYKCHEEAAGEEPNLENKVTGWKEGWKWVISAAVWEIVFCLFWFHFITFPFFMTAFPCLVSYKKKGHILPAYTLLTRRC